jgi:hypothetical protein
MSSECQNCPALLDALTALQADNERLKGVLGEQLTRWAETKQWVAIAESEAAELREKVKGYEAALREIASGLPSYRATLRYSLMQRMADSALGGPKL